jgi:ribosomal protein S27E
MSSDPIYCPSCGTACQAGANFCFKCGASFAQINQVASQQSKSDFITLACPNCGGKLDITPDTERFACKFCGMEHIVRRTGGVTSLSPVVESLKRVETKFDQVLTGSDRIAAEQTIQRLKREIPELEKQVAAKELEYKEASRNSLRNIGNITGLIGIFLFLLMSYLAANDMIYDRGDFFKALIIFSIICLIMGLICITISASQQYKAKHATKSEQVKAELTRLQENLQNYKQQLEQLHRYTAER